WQWRAISESSVGTIRASHFRTPSKTAASSACMRNSSVLSLARWVGSTLPWSGFSVGSSNICDPSIVVVIGVELQAKLLQSAAMRAGQIGWVRRRALHRKPDRPIERVVVDPIRLDQILLLAQLGKFLCLPLELRLRRVHLVQRNVVLNRIIRFRIRRFRK